MSVSQKKLDANRSNAQKSTGPRTAGGKSAARLNAVTHGVFCRDLVLPGEDKDFFLALREDLFETFRPGDAMEIMLVDRIVSATWRLNRLQESEMWLHAARDHEVREGKKEMDRHVAAEAEAQGLPAPTPLTLPPEGQTPGSVTLYMLLSDKDCAIERYQRYEQRLELSISRATRELEKLRKRAKKEHAEAEQADEEPAWVTLTRMLRETEPTDEVHPGEEATERKSDNAKRENEPTEEQAEESKLNPERPTSERKSETKPKTGNAGDLGEGNSLSSYARRGQG